MLRTLSDGEPKLLSSEPHEHGRSLCEVTQTPKPAIARRAHQSCSLLEAPERRFERVRPFGNHPFRRRSGLRRRWHGRARLAGTANGNRNERDHTCHPCADIEKASLRRGFRHRLDRTVVCTSMCLFEGIVPLWPGSARTQPDNGAMGNVCGNLHGVQASRIAEAGA